jgi:hypothetical protein
MTRMNNRPSWYTDEHDSSWEQMKAAFRRDWEQTKHDFGSDHARDLNQDAGDTVRQAMGGSASDRGQFEDREPAFRFGHAARNHYRTNYPTWNSDLESQLRNDYGSNFDRDRDDIRYAWDYRGSSLGSTAEDRTDVRR